MASYVVHVPPESDAILRAEGTAFVRDGFSLWAFLFGPLYFLRHRAWLAAAGWIIVVALGWAFCALLHLPAPAREGLLLLAAWLTGLEAGTLRAWSLDRRGFAVADVVEGGRRDVGEHAFFSRAAGRQAMPPPRTARPLAGDGPVIGYE